MLNRMTDYARKHALGCAALFLALSGTAGAVAVSASSHGTYRACAQKGTGQVFLQGPGFRRHCSKDEYLITLAKRGPRGETGPRGPAGPATGAASGDLTGHYPGPKIAAGKVTTADLAPGAKAPDAADLGGIPASSYPQGHAYASTAVADGFGPVHVGAVPGVGTLNLSCSGGNVASYTYKNNSADAQDVGIDNNGTQTFAYDLVPTQTTPAVTVPASLSAHLTFMVMDQGSAPSVQYNVLDDDDGANCNLFLDDIIYPTTS